MRTPLYLITTVFLSLLTLTGCALLPFEESDRFSQAQDAQTLSWDEIYSQEEERRRIQHEAETEAHERQEQAVRRAIASRDVVVGMRAEEVMTAWGQPRDVDYAGQPGSGNERWVYSEGLSAMPGLRPRRIIYFEEGKVAGWETSR